MYTPKSYVIHRSQKLCYTQKTQVMLYTEDNFKVILYTEALNHVFTTTTIILEV